MKSGLALWLAAGLSLGGCAAEIGDGESGPERGSTSAALSVSQLRPAVGDFDGDGRVDLSVKMSDGVWFINYAANGFGASQQWHGWDARFPAYGPLSSLITAADYDGDGKTDLSVKDNDGNWYIDYARDGFGGWNAVFHGYGDNSGVPVPADYDGDGKADLSVKGADGNWYIDYARDGFGSWNEIHGGYGGSGAIPAPADYDGDGKTDLSVKDAGGVWYIDYARDGFGHWNESHAGYGENSGQLVPADYDGDHKADLSIKGADGTWYIDYARDGFGSWNEIHGGYGGSSIAVPADYDHDGRADLAVNDGTWLFDYARDGFGSWNASAAGTPKPALPDDLWVDHSIGRIIYRWSKASYADSLFINEYRNGQLYHSETLDGGSTRETDFFPDAPGGTQFCFQLQASNTAGTSAWSSRPCYTVPGSSTPPPPTAPDLAPYNVYLNPGTPDPGQSITFSWQECNFGNAAAGGYEVRVYHNGAQVYSATREGLAAGACIVPDGVDGIAVKDGYWDVALDVLGQVAESNESNNMNHYGY